MRHVANAMVAAAIQGLRERRQSARLLWPFLRLLGPTATAVGVLEREGVGAAELVRPDTRLRHRAVMDLFDLWVERSGNPALGLRAGLSIEAGDLETMEYAARACANLREAIHCCSRYIHLLNEATDLSLVEYRDRALIRLSVSDGVPTSRVANDFAVACVVTFAKRYALVDEPVLELHLMHPQPADTTAYDVFRAKIRFGMPHNGFLISRALLDRPMVYAHPAMRDAFEAYARDQSEKLTSGVRGRVREIITAQLASGEMTMESVSAALGVSVATLRRRLEEEGTTFTGLVDEVRRDLAERHLSDPHRTISEVAFMLGFAHAPAFHKAFRRWTGATPSERRARLWT
jgi:AraC-like DNA-binding protein